MACSPGQTVGERGCNSELGRTSAFREGVTALLDFPSSPDPFPEGLAPNLHYTRERWGDMRQWTGWLSPLWVIFTLYNFHYTE